MGNRDRSDKRRDDSPVQKKRKTKRRSPSSSSSSSENELNKSDEIEVLYVKVENEGGKKKKKKRNREKSEQPREAGTANDRRANDLNEITQQLLASTQRESELRKELTETQAERDKANKYLEKCCLEARTYQRRAEYAESNVEKLESKNSNDPGLRQENIRLHTQVGDLMRQKIELQKEVDEGKKKLHELSKQLEEQIRLRSEKEKGVDKGKEKREETKTHVRRESGERGSQEKKDDYYEKEARRLRKERDEWKVVAEDEKKKNRELERDFDNVEAAVRRLQDDCEDEKEKREKLECKLKEVESRRAKADEEFEKKMSNGVSTKLDEEMKRLKEEKAKWMEEFDIEKKKNEKLESQLQESRGNMQMDVQTTEVWCQTEPEKCEVCPRLNQRIRLKDEALRKERAAVETERANWGREMGRVQGRLDFLEVFYHQNAQPPPHFHNGPYM